jgi:preprotein translocase subunit SecD
LSQPGNIKVREERFLVREAAEMRVSRFASVELLTAGMYKRTVLSFHFTEAEAAEFRDLTALNVGRRMAMLIDGEIHFPPKQIQSAVEGGVVQVHGYLYNPPLRKLVKTLDAGPLPCRLEEVSHEVE